MNEKHVTREELYAAIWQTPLTHLSKSFGIPTHVLTKICEQFNIPRPGPDYWPCRKLGYEVEQMPLPPAASDTPTIIKLEWIPKKTATKKAKSPVISAASSESIKGPKPPAQPAIPIIKQTKVAPDFRNAHPLVRSSWEYFKGHHCYTDPQGRLQPTDRQQCLDLTVTKTQLRRALLLFDAIIRACAQRGWKTYKPETPYYHRNPHTLIVIGKEEIRIGIIEKVIKREPTEAEVESEAAESTYSRQQTYYTTTGLLCVGTGWNRFESRRAILEKTDAPLENRIHEVIESLEHEAEKSRKNTLQREEGQRIRNEQERLRLEPLRRQEEENNRRRNLEKLADQWHTSERIRSLINACEKQFNVSPNEAATRWLAWAHQHADRSDPLRNGLIQQALDSLPSS
jgi:hypothetical protein